MLKNGLKLNALKSKCILIHSSRKKVDDNLELFVDGSPIEQVRVMKFLGVLLNDTLTWSDHIVHICTKVSRSLNLHLSWFLPKSLLLYFKSYVIPSLTLLCLFSQTGASIYYLKRQKKIPRQTICKCLNSLAASYLTCLFDTRSTHHNKCINHKATEPPCDPFLLWTKSFQLCRCFGVAIPTQQCSSVQRLSYFLQTVQYMTYFSFPWNIFA